MQMTRLICLSTFLYVSSSTIHITSSIVDVNLNHFYSSFLHTAQSVANFHLPIFFTLFSVSYLRFVCLLLIVLHFFATITATDYADKKVVADVLLVVAEACKFEYNSKKRWIRFMLIAATTTGRTSDLPTNHLLMSADWTVSLTRSLLFLPY